VDVGVHRNRPRSRRMRRRSIEQSAVGRSGSAETGVHEHRDHDVLPVMGRASGSMERLKPFVISRSRSQLVRPVRDLAPIAFTENTVPPI
jgi:hypothetical protein